MNNPLPGTAKFSTQMCQRKQTDGVTVVVKNTAEDFEARKASHKYKNRLETVHFKTISGRGRRLRTLGLRFWRPPLYQLSYSPILRFKSGGPSGTRTPDRPVMSRLLYQLS